MSSPSAGLHAGWAWGLTCAVVLAGGAALYGAGGAIGTTLDRWLPKLERTARDTPPPAPPASPAPAPAVEPPSEPAWTYVDIEDAMRPLPEHVEALIAEGRDELSQFADLDPADETRALLMRNRWRLWGRVWHNRVEHVREPMPPIEACYVHAALEPTCRAIRDSLTLLDRVPAASSAAKAEELLDGAGAILEELSESQTESEEPADESAVP
jgi:hypothetical protein